jgi:hypothetical protein
MKQTLQMAPGQTTEYIMVRNGQVWDRLILNTDQYPYPAARVHELWDQYMDERDTVYVRVFPKLEG